MFWPTYDSWGSDISHNAGGSAVNLAQACDLDARCKGFNTKGDLKSFVRTADLWTSWTTDTCKGLYVKQAKKHDVDSKAGAGADGAGKLGNMHAWAARWKTLFSRSKK